MAHRLKLNITEYNQNFNNVASWQNICACCLSKNVPLLDLRTCKHKAFFDCFYKSMLEYSTTLICNLCHHFLKKIELFKKQVDDSIFILNEVSDLQKNQKVYNLMTSPMIFSTFDSELVNDEVGLPIIEGPEPEHFDVTTDVKIEHDSSDLETDVPLSEIKKQSKKKKLKPNKVKPKKRTSIKDKYDGKIRIIKLSNEELMEERVRESKKEAYLNLPYKCESCITGFDHEVTLKEHMEKRHGHKKGCFVCEICKSVLSTETSFKEHTKRHVRRYECKECGKRNNNVYSVVKHYNDRHGKISVQFTCQDCGFVTDSHRSYTYHRDKHKQKEQCILCGNTFVNSTGLKVHMYTVHKQSSRVYSCTTCNKVYNAKSGLLAHITSTHKPRHAYCVACKQHFRTSHNLAHHLKTHSNHVKDCDRRFICNECDAKFLLKSSLQEHIDWVHLKNTKHECTDCNKVFKNSAALRKHKSFVHEKKRPPRNKICDYCGRGFTTLTILQSHIRTHTGERPLQCAHCPATFAHSAALYTHNKLLHSAARVQ